MEQLAAQIGPAHYLRVSRTYKQKSRALYEGVLRADVKSLRPDIDIFTFADGSRIGISTSMTSLPQWPARRSAGCGRSSVSTPSPNISKRPVARSLASYSGTTGRWRFPLCPDNQP